MNKILQVAIRIYFKLLVNQDFNIYIKTFRRVIITTILIFPTLTLTTYRDKAPPKVRDSIPTAPVKQYDHIYHNQ